MIPMKKIYILINHFQTQDGVARTAVGLANELAKRGHQVTLQSLFKFEPGMKSWLLPQVEAKPFCGFYFRGFSKVLKLLPDRVLYRMLVKERYDVEIGFCMEMPEKIIAASTNTDCRHYGWIHGYDKGLKLLDTYRKMDKIVAVSKCNEERFREETGGTIPVCCCHNLVDDNKVRTMGAEAIPVERGPEMTFVVVGRLEPGKGVLRLIECCGKLKQEGEKLSLWVIGDGEERSKLEKRTEELGLTENVRFFGAQSNPYAYMSRADLLVCASFAEGYSTVCVEANMLGIPVLSTCVDGAKEIVDDAGAGMVVGMDDDSLCDGLRKVLREPELVAEWKKTVETTRQVFSYRNRAAELDQLDF